MSCKGQSFDSPLLSNTTWTSYILYYRCTSVKLMNMVYESVPRVVNGGAAILAVVEDARLVTRGVGAACPATTSSRMLQHTTLQ